MKRMLSYMGGKYRLSARMLPPQRDLVIEPFAGGASYSLRYEPKQVLLIERNAVVASVWRYLISVPKNDILSLPIYFDHVDELRVCQEAKWLIGFWLGPARPTPGKSRSAWGRKYLTPTAGNVWSEAVRQRIAENVEKIRHWNILEESYEEAPDVEAHWVVDPPYEVAGRNYPTHLLDYEVLARWCRLRKGYVVVHEAEGASWLPFRTFHTMLATNGPSRKGFSNEVIWTKETQDG